MVLMVLLALLVLLVLALGLENLTLLARALARTSQS
jgi:hypothetical protein